ncbi:Protein N-acetyltransferase, RimJ/RimL family [Lentzea fradiae]|uniref:Protein N-acetyltransferase, RimJ/RimL family n=1 Tax=Lentzea fradiae TaxID=200378 RepID=A0A1G7Q1E7_9PSEU|nr:GNAT family N-acetyltransferase [Lentzea fradiae]SDF92311.1 Protein N-acetyltransferase, RimJ/RimL family [Lentzea fradiae]
MLTGDLVRLRPVEPEDADTFYRWHNDEEVMRWLQAYFHTSLAAVRKRFAERQENSHERVTFSIETLEGKLIGVVALRDVHPVNARAEVDIYIGEKDHWGGGYGTDALRTVCRYGFDTMRLESIQLGVVEANERAVRSYQKVGFQVDGRYRRSFFRDGVWHDSLLMCVLRDELT